MRDRLGVDGQVAPRVDFGRAITIGMIRNLLENELGVPSHVFEGSDGEILIIVFGSVSAPRHAQIFDTLKERLPVGIRQTWRFFPEPENEELRDAIEATWRLAGAAGVTALVNEAGAVYRAKRTCPTCGVFHPNKEFK